MAFKMNTIKCDLCSYPHYILLGQRKTGKTTFWRDLVIEAWGSADKGLLISAGIEEGYHALDNLQVEVAPAWNQDFDEETQTRGLVQIIDDIIDNNKEYGLKGVCIDTFDTLVDIAEAEVLRLSKRETGKPCKSLNDAFGGYGRGMDKLIDIIEEQVARLRSIGLAVFIISHVKDKERSDMITGEKYSIITNNLYDKVYTAIADTAQMTMMVVNERDIQGGKISNEHRALYLRGTATIDAGGRFNGLPEKIEFTPKAFLEAFKIGVKNSATVKDLTDTDIEKAKKREAAEAEKVSEVAKRKDEAMRRKIALESEEDNRTAYFNKISEKFPESSDEVKAKVRELAATAGGKKFSDLAFPIDVLKEIAEML